MNAACCAHTHAGSWQPRPETKAGPPDSRRVPRQARARGGGGGGGGGGERRWGSTCTPAGAFARGAQRAHAHARPWRWLERTKRPAALEPACWRSLLRAVRAPHLPSRCAGATALGNHIGRLAARAVTRRDLRGAAKGKSVGGPRQCPQRCVRACVRAARRRASAPPPPRARVWRGATHLVSLARAALAAARIVHAIILSRGAGAAHWRPRGLQRPQRLRG